MRICLLYFVRGFGVFDSEFTRLSCLFFEQVRSKRFQVVVSPIVQDEIQFAPENVRNLFDSLHPLMEFADISEQALLLRQAYLSAGVVTPKSSSDALHVAIATVTNCHFIISWNFKHIVNFQKILLYQAVNKIHGYQEINIYSPLEVIDDGNEDI
jgi:hypothetical protein